MTTATDSARVRSSTSPAAAPEPVEVHRPGVVPYDRALRWQRDRAEAIRRHEAPEAIVLLQHPPVYTLGRRARPEHLLIDPDALAARGAQVTTVERGGDVTFHGPGQLVVYPLLRLRARGIGPAAYVRALEESMIRTLAGFGAAHRLAAHRVAVRPGVWVTPQGPDGPGEPERAVGADGAAPRKIGAVGVRLARGVSLHGLALNVSPDLHWFDAIVPCGLPDAQVTSLARERPQARPPSVEAVAERLLAELCALLGLDPVAAAPGATA